MADNRRIRIIENYERLKSHVMSWFEGFIPFLALIGNPGLGKTHSYESLGTKKLHLFRGRSSAISIFEAVKAHPDRPIVFDDVGQLLRDPSSLDLMKQLCDTRPVRRIRWRTKAVDETEQVFKCTSRVLVVLNSVPANNPDVAAILDRFDVIRFAPTKKEILAVMRRIAKDPADVEIIARADVMPTLRTLKHFEAWKASPYLNATEELYAECGVPDSIKLMIRVLETTSKGRWVKTYARLSGKPYEAAKRDWSRNWKTAKGLLEARGAKPKTK